MDTVNTIAGNLETALLAVSAIMVVFAAVTLGVTIRLKRRDSQPEA